MRTVDRVEPARCRDQEPSAAGAGVAHPDPQDRFFTLALVGQLVQPLGDRRLQRHLEQHLDGMKREYMERALAEADGVQTRAAELLGMSFRSFRYYAKKFGIGDEAAHSE